MTTRSLEHLCDLSPEQRAQIEHRINAFEQVWQRGKRPAITDHLPADPVLRRLVLVELVHIELERRIKAGEPVRVESYLKKFPELASLSDGVVDLIRAEFACRKDRGQAVDVVEYKKRFPMLGEKLLVQGARLIAVSGVSTRSFTKGDHETLFLPPAEQQIKRDKSGWSLPEQFGRYRILRPLGQGAMGTVYLAEDTQLGRRVALKTPSFGNDNSGKLLQRFEREARAAATLNHANICAVFDVGQIEGKQFISMAYVEGRTLAAYVQPDKPQPERRILIVVRKLALALQHAHDHGIVHRDMKPSNVMVDERGEPIVMDFGLAQQIQSEEQIRLTQSGVLIGSPAYMSPEQVAADPERIGPQTDQYSLGVILYELLTGELPFRGAVTAVIGKIVAKKPKPPSQLRPGLDPRIEAACLKMMAKRRQDRFPSLRAVADELAAILRQPGDSKRKAEKPTTLSAGNLATLTEMANKCLARHDYDQAVRVLEEVPEAVRNDDVGVLLRRARDLSDEVVFLLLEIDEAMRLGDGPTALAKAFRLAELKPGHRRVLEIREQVLDVTLRTPSEPKREVKSDHQRVGLATRIPPSWVRLGSVAFILAMGALAILRPGGEVGKVDPAQQNVSPVPQDEIAANGPVIEKRDMAMVTATTTKSESPTKEPGPPPIATNGPLSATSKPPEPLIAPFDETAAKNARQQWAKHLKTFNEVTNSIGMRLALIPAGEFLMGAAVGEEQTSDDEKPQHRVRITKPFYLGTHEVTQGDFERLMRHNPSYFSAGGDGEKKVSGQDTSRFPVERVSWYDAVEFCNTLSKNENRPSYYRVADVVRNEDGSIKTADVTAVGGLGYRLPTEAEWEYACRAGTTTPFHFGAALNGSDANSNGNFPYGTTEKGPYLERTTTVGLYKPNAFGLYDMHGNVSEWCWDEYDERSYNSPESDPAGPSGGSHRVFRVGSWLSDASDCRAAYRGWDSPGLRVRALGFRLARGSHD